MEEKVCQSFTNLLNVFQDFYKALSLRWIKIGKIVFPTLKMCKKIQDYIKHYLKNPRAWCKTILICYIKYGSYNSSASIPQVQVFKFCKQ